MDLLFTHRKPDVLFLRGICTIFVGWNYYKGFALVKDAMETGNLRATYLLCMLELLTGDLEFFEVEQVYTLLGSLKDNADMMWLRATMI